jgi:serine/threonine protein kinase
MYDVLVAAKLLTLVFRDLQPDNVLLGAKGHLLITYMCRWAAVDSEVSAEAIERLYTAPEVNGIFELTPAADWWSFGAIVFELLTGKVCKYKYNIQLGIDI